jgi:hypothetical protein
MKRVALGKFKVLLRNGANVLKIIIYEPFIINFSILGLIFHNLSQKWLNRFTDEQQQQWSELLSAWWTWWTLKWLWQWS